MVSECFRRSCVIWLESHPSSSGVSAIVSGYESRKFCFLPSVVLILRQRMFCQASSLLSDDIFSVAVISSC